MSAFLEGIGKVIGKISDHIQGRGERTKNKIDALERERDEILSKPATVKSSLRIHAIDRELVKLRGLLKNSAPSS